MRTTATALAFVGAALAAVSPAHAAQVYVSGQGYLDQATGAHAVGEAFSFSFSYDDQVKPSTTFSPGFYGYTTGGPISFRVGSQSYVDQQLYYLEYSTVTKELYVGPPADYGGPRAFISLATNRTDSSTILPAADQVSNKAGAFRFELYGIPGYASTGSGLLISAVPETSTWGMMILGMGMIGGVMRRRKNVRTAVKFA